MQYGGYVCEECGTDLNPRSGYPEEDWHTCPECGDLTWGCWVDTA